MMKKKIEALLFFRILVGVLFVALMGCGGSDEESSESEDEESQIGRDIVSCENSFDTCVGTFGEVPNMVCLDGDKICAVPCSSDDDCSDSSEFVGETLTCQSSESASQRVCLEP